MPTRAIEAAIAAGPGLRRPPARIGTGLLRLSAAALLLGLLAVAFGEALVRALLPLFATVFGWVAAEFRLLALTVSMEGADRVLRAEVTIRQTFIVGGKLFFADARGSANASTLMAHALQGPLAALLVALAWPARRALEAVTRLLLLVPLLVVVAMIDVPCVLAAELWQMVVEKVAPRPFSLLMLWRDFLQGGGRHALGLMAGGAAVIVAARAQVRARATQV